MKRLISLLALALPLSVSAQIYHHLFAQPQWDNPYEPILPLFYPLNDGGVASINILYFEHSEQQKAMNLFIADDNGDITAAYGITDILPARIYDIVEYGGNQYFEFFSQGVNGGPNGEFIWEQSRYRINGSFQTIYSELVSISPEYYREWVTLDLTGFRFSTIDAEFFSYVSRYDHEGARDWSYYAEFSFDFSETRAPHNATNTLFLFIEDNEYTQIDLIQIDLDGNQQWKGRISDSDLANALGFDVAYISTVDARLFDDNQTLLTILVADDFDEVPVLVLIDASGNITWSAKLEGLADPFFFYDGPDVLWRKSADGLISYSTPYGTAGVIKPQTNQMYEFADETFETNFYTFDFVGGDVAVAYYSLDTESDPQFWIYDTGYLFFNQSFQALQTATWRHEDRSAGFNVFWASFNDYIFSQFYNKTSYLVAQEPTDLITAGFIGETATTHGQLLPLSTINLTLKPTTRSLENGPNDLDLQITDTPPLQVEYTPAVRAYALPTAETSINDLTPANMHASGPIDYFGSPTGAFFSFPWFDYDTKQAPNLTDWATVFTDSNSYGFQYTFNINEPMPYFEQVIASDPTPDQ